jgi:hypothetical protein
MKLSSGQKTYPKFHAPGDSVKGAFVSYTEGVAGKFGPENTLILKDGDEQCIRCPSSLSKTLKVNAAALKPGVWLTITFTKTVPTTKGNPAKIFDVELFPEGEPAKAAAPAQVEDPIPF